MSVRTHFLQFLPTLARAGRATVAFPRRAPRSGGVLLGLLAGTIFLTGGPARAFDNAQGVDGGGGQALLGQALLGQTALVPMGLTGLSPTGGVGKAGPRGLSRPSAEALVKIDTLISLISLISPASPATGGLSGGPAGSGGTLELAVIMRIEPHWHVYWRNPGDSGAPVDISVKAAKGVTVGEIKWPTPKRFTNEFETTFGYEKEVALLVPITIDPSATRVPTELTVDIRWMVCRDVCLTGTTSRTVSVPSASPVLDEAQRSAIERSRARLPKPIAEAGSAIIEGSLLVITGTAAGAAAIEFFPFDTPGVTYGAARSSVANGAFRVEVPLEINPGNALGKPLRAGGVVSLGADSPSYELLLPAPSRSANR